MFDSSGFRVRVEGRLRQEFLEACRAQDRTAAQVIREFMRTFVQHHYVASQATLFDEQQFDEQQSNLRGARS
jgi:hypothetical protein